MTGRFHQLPNEPRQPFVHGLAQATTMQASGQEIRRLHHQPRHWRAGGRAARGGLTLLESSVATILLLAGLSALLQLMHWTRLHQREVENRQRALELAQNALASVRELPPAERDTVGLARCVAIHAEWLSQTWPSAELRLLAAADATHGGQWIRAEVHWRMPSGVAARPVQLATWISPAVAP